MKKRLAALLSFSLIAFLCVSPFNPLLVLVNQSPSANSVSMRDQLVNQLLTYVPSNASIITCNAFFPHVSSRTNAYVLPTIPPIWKDHEAEGKDFIQTILEKVEYILVDTKTDPSASSVVFSLIGQNSTFKLLTSVDSVVLFKRDYAGNATVLLPYDTILSPYDATYDVGSLKLYSGELVTSPNSTSNKVLHCTGTFEEPLMFWFSQRNPLPPGDYNITMKAKINTDESFRVDVCADEGRNILLSKNFSSTDFVKDQWTYLTTLFRAALPLPDFEIKTILFPQNADIYVDYVEVRQMIPD